MQGPRHSSVGRPGLFPYSMSPPQTAAPDREYFGGLFLSHRNAFSVESGSSLVVLSVVLRWPQQVTRPAGSLLCSIASVQGHQHQGYLLKQGGSQSSSYCMCLQIGSQREAEIRKRPSRLNCHPLSCLLGKSTNKAPLCHFTDMVTGLHRADLEFSVLTCDALLNSD